MKLIALILSIFVTSPILAQSFSKGIVHEIQKDRIAKEGQIHIQYREVEEQRLELKFNYKFRYGILLYRGNYSGSRVQEIPAIFATEQGYIDLERSETFEDEKVILTHMGRKNWRHHYDCHVIGLTPKKDRANWKGILTYCPDLPEVGFARVEMIIDGVPVLGSHTLVSHYIR